MRYPVLQNLYYFISTLVFFDDGYASYIKHQSIRVVCSQTDNAVWDDVHPNSREFVKKYLQQYPERPMVKLSVKQCVSVEWEGKVQCKKKLPKLGRKFYFIKFLQFEKLNR